MPRSARICGCLILIALFGVVGCKTSTLEIVKHARIIREANMEETMDRLAGPGGSVEWKEVPFKTAEGQESTLVEANIVTKASEGERTATFQFIVVPEKRNVQVVKFLVDGNQFLNEDVVATLKSGKLPTL